jgi:hypothetical protein
LTAKDPPAGANGNDNQLDNIPVQSEGKKNIPEFRYVNTVAICIK